MYALHRRFDYVSGIQSKMKRKIVINEKKNRVKNDKEAKAVKKVEWKLE